jgi:cathepsin D
MVPVYWVWVCCSVSDYLVTPLFHTLFNEAKLPQLLFSFKLTASGGELYVGGMNEALYIDSSLAFTPVTNPVSVNAR